MRNKDSMGEDMFKVGAGLLAVEAGPGMVENAMNDIFKNSKFSEGISQVSQTEVGKIGGNALSWVQSGAPAAAALGFAVIGLETMCKKANLPGQEQAS